MNSLTFQKELNCNCVFNCKKSFRLEGPKNKIWNKQINKRFFSNVIVYLGFRVCVVALHRRKSRTNITGYISPESYKQIEKKPANFLMYINFVETF